jgi:hypothetical protein
MFPCAVEGKQRLGIQQAHEIKKTHLLLSISAELTLWSYRAPKLQQKLLGWATMFWTDVYLPPCNFAVTIRWRFSLPSCIKKRRIFTQKSPPVDFSYS